jgi:ABC-type Co2+ transport system permease subunit
MGFYIYLRKRKSVRWAVRMGFIAVIGGLFAYTLIALNLPEGNNLIMKFGRSFVYIFVFFGILAGLAGGVIWEKNVK